MPSNGDGVVGKGFAWRNESMPWHTVAPRKNFVANLWTEFSAHRGEALATNGKELQNP
jgi:hypothetical protein